MNNDILDDLYRVSGKSDFKSMLSKFMYDDGFRFLFFWRKTKSSKGFRRKVYYYFLNRIKKRLGIEIPLSVELGTGIQLLHPFAITINSKAKIGNNCVLLKGSTIGNQKRGKRKGVPTIGDDFYLGLNSSVVGNVIIGNDVLIAANTFVNFDVPSHSIVVGSPGVIHKKENATEGYISNRLILPVDL